MIEQVTIIIPTHNRPLLIARALHYYAKWGCKIIVADSSSKPGREKKIPNVEHLHYPNEMFSKKIYNALQLVQTPYVCLCADDDFLTLNGILSGMGFLDENRDYVSVQGRYIQFTLSYDTIACFPLYHIVYGMHINSEDPGERIIESARIGMQHLYALHRTHVLQTSFYVCKDVASSTMAEYTSNLVSMFFGKHIMLPAFWMARDSARYTEYNYAQATPTTLLNKEKLRNFLLSIEGIEYRQLFSQLFAEITGHTIDEGLRLVDQAYFDIYLIDKKKSAAVTETGDVGTNIKKKNLRSFIKSFISPKIIKYCRSFTPKKLIRWRWKMIYSFPFLEDPSYLRDWKTIVKTIKKFGTLPTVTNKITS